jgi:hypothetical protein
MFSESITSSGLVHACFCVLHNLPFLFIFHMSANIIHLQRMLQPHVLKEPELRLNHPYHDLHNHGSTRSASHSVPTINSSQPKAAPSLSRCKHILDEPVFWPLSSNQRSSLTATPNIAEIYSTLFFFSHSTLALAILINSSAVRSVLFIGLFITEIFYLA